MKKLVIKDYGHSPVIDVSLETLDIKKQALVFVNTRNSAEKTAEDISKQLKENSAELDELSNKIHKTLAKPTKQCERLAKCVKKGIAFHHAGLLAKQRDLIEENFRKGIIRIIACTPTLALGISMPAYRTIIRDLKRYSHRGYDWIPVLEYLQQAGRAGRPEFDKEGQAIAIASTEAEKNKIIEKYIKGEAEEIYSKLAVEPVLRTYLLSLISIGFVRDKKQIIDFFSKTFWAFQFADMKELTLKIEKMLKMLEKWQFIKSSQKEDFVPADDMQNERFYATAIGKRAAELYIDPLTAHHLIGCLKKVSSRKTVDFSFLQAISNSLEMRPLLRIRAKEHETIQESLIKYEMYLLQIEPSMFDPEYEYFISSIKTALFFSDWANEKDDDYLMENYSIRPGETRIKLNIADWLLYCLEEFCRLMQMQPLIKDIVRLKLRVKYGVKEELLPLLKLGHVGRVRARKLYTNKIKNIADVRNADLPKLVYILGRKTALEVKKQVDEEIKEIPKGKRKGQTSLGKYDE